MKAVPRDSWSVLAAAGMPDFIPPGARPACREPGVDPETFFPTGLEGAGRPAQVLLAEARKICRRCDFRVGCADYAADTGQRWGIWGALTPAELEKRRLCRLGQCEHRSHWRRAA